MKKKTYKKHSPQIIIKNVKNIIKIYFRIRIESTNVRNKINDKNKVHKMYGIKKKSCDTYNFSC